MKRKKKITCDLHVYDHNPVVCCIDNKLCDRNRDVDRCAKATFIPHRIIGCAREEIEMFETSLPSLILNGSEKK